MATVRQQITIDASARQVWNVLATEEGVRSWWSQTARLEAREGGRIVLGFGEGEEATEARGLFHALKPTREIEIAWEIGTTSLERGTRTAFLIGRQGTDTKVHVVVTGAPLADDAVREAIDAGWKVSLARLRAVFEG